MLHPSISAAMAHDRHTDLMKAAARRRLVRAAKAGMPHQSRQGR